MKNWKTSLLGIAAAALNLLSHGVNWKSVLFSLTVGGIGLSAKDADKSTVIIAEKEGRHHDR